MMGFVKKVLFWIFLAGLAQIAYKNLILMGVHKTVYNHAPGKCERVKNIEWGSEDIQMLPNGLALISGGLKYGVDVTTPHWSKVRGYLKLFDFAHAEKGAQEVNIKGDLDMESFNPHGISVFVDNDSGKVYVFVINHAPAKQTVEKFSFDESTRTATLLESIDVGEHPMNDLVAVSKDSFYITEHTRYKEKAWFMLEMLVQIRWGKINFYDGKTLKTSAVDGLFLPNGINTSPDKTLIYLSNIGDQSIDVFKRNPDNMLEQIQSYPVHTVPDNLDISEDGHIWATCHPMSYKLIAYAEDPNTNLSPSQVLRLKLDKEGKISDMIEVYANDGSEISGSSVAVHHKGKMLVGTVASNSVLCDTTTLQ